MKMQLEGRNRMFGRILKSAFAAIFVAGMPLPVVVQSASAAPNSFGTCRGEISHYLSDKRLKSDWMLDQAVDQVCEGSQTAGPALCYLKAFSGTLNWGGGTNWSKENAAYLCRGAITGTARVACFENNIANGVPFVDAVNGCLSSDLEMVSNEQQSLQQPGLQEPQQPSIQPVQVVPDYESKPGELGPFILASTQSGTPLAVGRDAVGQAWMIEPVDGRQPPEFVRIRSLTGDNSYLNIETGPLNVSAVEPGWWSAMWVMEKTGRGYRFQNRWKPDVYVGDPNGNPIGEFTLNAANLAPPSSVANAQTAKDVALRIQNLSGLPVDVFIMVDAETPGYVQTVGANEELGVSTLPGTVWYLAQNDEWVTSVFVGNEPQQFFPFER